MNRIITISREFGSGGRTIGKLVADRLGIRCYDEELITRTARETGLAEEYIREHGEHTEPGGWLNSILTTRDYRGRSIMDQVWSIQSEVIKELADREPCVIVGRCANYLLRDRADLLTVFIHAAQEERIKRIVHVYGEGDDAPEKRLRDKDKKRRNYYQMYTDMKWGDATDFHITLDSGVLGIERCAELLIELYRT